jgi:DNA-binding transcriptional ArsR family regulator
MDDAVKLQTIFQTLGDANRLRIIKFVGEQECSVSEIVRAIELSQPLVSHHLKLLRNMNILETRRNGPFVLHKLKDRRILDALGIFLELSTSINNEYLETPMFRSPMWWRGHC